MLTTLHSCVESGGVVGFGARPASIACVGIAPGRDEWLKTRRPFTGESGQLLRAAFQAAKVDIEHEVFFTNLCCSWDDEPTEEMKAECRPRLMQELAEAQPKLLIALGAQARDALLPAKQRRGWPIWSDTYGCWTMYTVHPAAIIRKEGAHFLFDLMRDIMKVPRIVGWNVNEVQADVQYEVIEDYESAQQLLISLKGQYTAIDVESRYKHSQGLLCAGLATDNGTYVLVGDRALAALDDYEIKWEAQNGIFDIGKIRELLGKTLRLHEDSLLMDYSLDERGGKEDEAGTEGALAGGKKGYPVGIHGLESMAVEFLGVKPWKKDKLGSIEEVWDSGEEGRQRVIEYNAKDVTFTHRLVNHFRPLQSSDGVRDMYNKLLIPASNALSQIRQYGVLVDPDVLTLLKLEWAPRWLELEDRLITAAKGHVDNVGSAPQILKYVYDVMGVTPKDTTKNQLKTEKTKGGRSTSKWAIDDLSKRDDEVGHWLKDLIEWRQIDHLLNTYVTGIENLMDSNYRVHPDPILFGTRPGRLAYNNPAINTIPKHGEELSKVRRAFIAPPGYELIEADFRQSELWWCYFHSGDMAIKRALDSGDFHGATTTSVFGVSPPTPCTNPSKDGVPCLRCEACHYAADFDVKRHDSKRISFGILYGRGAKSLSEADYGSGHSFAYWRDAVKTWERTYPDFWDWRKGIKHTASEEGEIQSLSGRKRRFWVILDYDQLNEAINMPIQAMSHDNLLSSLIQIQLENMLEPYGAHILFEIHDAMMIESPIAMRESVIGVIRSVMELPRFGAPQGVPVDISVGRNWLNVKKVKI
jgi:uracil-DNA glycosylase family 4